MNGSSKPLVLVTGASGSVGEALVPELEGHFRLRLHSRSAAPPSTTVKCEHVRGDIELPEHVSSIVNGVDAIVHLAGEANARATWAQVLGPNIDGTYNVFEAARCAGVRRIVFASTNHVTGMYDLEQAWPIDPAEPVRPDGPYGVSKACGEALARYYSDAFGMQVICLRIGWVLQEPFDEKGLRMWLSAGDLGRLVRGALETVVRFGVYYGVSANARSKWKLDNARAELGYHPEDNSEVFAELALGPGAAT